MPRICRCAAFALLWLSIATAAVAAGEMWSLKPIVKPTPPPGDAAYPIDRFIAAGIERAGLRASREADDRSLIRRVTFTLTGLPPSEAQYNQFTHDHTPNAYADYVDRLLASPAYGERWAQHWLDLVRFGESHGFEYDRPRPSAWPYRDYVIDALNRDIPYAEFIADQLAGDRLVGGKPKALAATGFLVGGPYDQAGNISANAVLRLKVREDELEELVATVGQTFLGLTVNCARCHDHKFDPIPTGDYYRMKAIFGDVDRGERTLTDPKIVAYVNTPKPHGPTRILLRGDVEKATDTVTPAPPSAITNVAAWKLPDNAGETEQRYRFAKWIADPENPLTWRVLVNRVWQHHFGAGLVRTPSDFGVNGEQPSHPELLDWLAAEFRASGGSLKHLHRLIVSSQAYRRSSQVAPGDVETVARIDAENRLLAHYPHRRLDAEALRDALLVVAGDLNRTVGGPSFRPFETTSFNSVFYHPIAENRPELLRRSIYRMRIVSFREPLLEPFDCPDPSVKTPVRGTTTTPLQALALMNDPFVQERIKSLVKRIDAESPDGTHRKRVERAYQTILMRSPRHEESLLAIETAANAGLATVVWAILNSNEFASIR